MGRSQGVVFGYGAIIPTKKFVKLFPGTFEHTHEYWTPKTNRIFDIETNVIKIFYSQLENTDQVFIATRSSVNYGFEKGFIVSDFVSVDMNKINNESQILASWLTEHFPNYPSGYMMYGYYIP